MGTVDEREEMEEREERCGEGENERQGEGRGGLVQCVGEGRKTTAKLMGDVEGEKVHREKQKEEEQEGKEGRLIP